MLVDDELVQIILFIYIMIGSVSFSFESFGRGVKSFLNAFSFKRY